MPYGPSCWPHFSRTTAARECLLESEQFLELGLGQDGHSQFLRFVVLRSGIGSHDDEIGLLADRARNFSAVLLHDLARLLARTIREAAGEDETLARKLVALDLALLRGRMHTRLVQLFDELAIGRL